MHYSRDAYVWAKSQHGRQERAGQTFAVHRTPAGWRERGQRQTSRRGMGEPMVRQTYDSVSKCFALGSTANDFRVHLVEAQLLSERPRPDLHGYCERHLISNRKKKPTSSERMTRTFVSSCISAERPSKSRWRTEGMRSMLIKITLALALAIATLASVSSHTNKVTVSNSLASGGGNLVPIW
jgi:hypothetical protein